jgi:hypothetical protein
MLSLGGLLTFTSPHDFSGLRITSMAQNLTPHASRRAIYVTRFQLHLKIIPMMSLRLRIVIIPQWQSSGALLNSAFSELRRETCANPPV